MANMTAILIAALLQGEEIIPLKTGTRWTYSIQMRGNQGEFVQSAVGTEKVNGVECTVLEAEVAGQKEKMWLHQNGEGVWLYRAQSRDIVSELAKPALLLKYPLKAENWAARIPSGTLMVDYQFLNEGQVEVRVHDRKYQAWKVRARGRTERVEFEVSYWYVNGVGLVKQVISSPHGETRIELKEFQR